MTTQTILLITTQIHYLMCSIRNIIFLTNYWMWSKRKPGNIDHRLFDISKSNMWWFFWENILLLLAGVSKFNVVTAFSSPPSLDNLAWLREEYICSSRGLRVKWGRPHQVNYKSYSHLVPSTGRCFSPPNNTQQHPISKWLTKSSKPWP